MANVISNENLKQLQQIAKMAYGSGYTEKTGGGSGYIGQIGGHTIKFATHANERPRGGITVYSSTRRSCNELRENLAEIARRTLGGQSGGVATGTLAKIYDSLGLSKTGRINENLTGEKSLLTRKAVAKALNAIAAEVNRGKAAADRVDVWSEAKNATVRNRFALTQEHTSFETVGTQAWVNHAVEHLKTFKMPIEEKLDTLPEHLVSEADILKEKIQEARETLVEKLTPHFKTLSHSGEIGPNAISDSEKNKSRTCIELAAKQFLADLKLAIGRLSKEYEEFLRKEDLLDDMTVIDYCSKVNVRLEKLRGILEGTLSLGDFEAKPLDVAKILAADEE